MKKYILLAAKYEYTKVKKERKKEKQDVVHNIDAVSHVMPRNEASASLHWMSASGMLRKASLMSLFMMTQLRPACTIISRTAWKVT
jgi:hypothetical protein